MTTTTTDAMFSFLLRSTVPLVLAPPGQPPGGVRLRGVVRADPPMPEWRSLRTRTRPPLSRSSTTWHRAGTR
jgi:hypothetical protein